MDMTVARQPKLWPKVRTGALAVFGLFGIMLLFAALRAAPAGAAPLDRTVPALGGSAPAADPTTTNDAIDAVTGVAAGAVTSVIPGLEPTGSTTATPKRPPRRLRPPPRPIRHPSPMSSGR